MNNQLTEKQAESLSALADGEATAAEVSELLEQEATQAHWYRYQMVSAVLRKEHNPLSGFDFTRAVSARIAEEATVLAPPKTAQADSAAPAQTAKIYSLAQHWRRATGGLAVAASVAAAMVFSVQTTQLADSGHNGSGLAQSTISPTKSELAEQAELEAIQNLLLLRSEQAMRAGEDTLLPESETVSGTETRSYIISSEQWREIEKHLKEQQQRRQSKPQH